MERDLHLLGQLLAAMASLTLLVAGCVVGLHAVIHRRERNAARDGQRLAMEFARFLAWQSDPPALRRAARTVRPAVFWSALEAFTDNIVGREWRRLSGVISDLPEVHRERMRLGAHSAWRRALAARHLGLLDARNVRAPLRQAMARGPTLVTVSAALALARMRDIPALVWLIEHPAATEALGRHRLTALLKRFGPRVQGVLRRAVRHVRNGAPIHLAAIGVLGLRRDPRQHRLLEQVLRQGALEARIAAARALGGIGAQLSVPVLCEALRDPAWQVRSQAARALGALSAEGAVLALEATLRDRSWWVRRHVAYALADLGPVGLQVLQRVATWDRDRYAREMAAEVLQALAWEHESPGGVSRVA